MQNMGDKRDYLFSALPPGMRNHILVDDVALYSVSPAWMAGKMCDLILARVGPGVTITDGTACVGGDTMAMAAVFTHVNAVKVHPGRADMLRSNVATVGLTDKVTVHCADYVSICGDLVQDVVVLDAPWGGPEYIDQERLDLFLGDTALVDVCATVWPSTRVILLKVPINFDFNKFFTDFKAKVDDAVMINCTHMRKAVAVMLSKQ